MHTELDKVFHDENKNSPSDFAFNLLDGKLGNLVGGRELVAQLLPPAAAQQALAQLPGKRQLETASKVLKRDFAKHFAQQALAQLPGQHFLKLGWKSCPCAFLWKL